MVFDESIVSMRRYDNEVVDLEKYVEKPATREEKKISHPQEQDVQDLEKETPQSNNNLPKAWKFVRNHHIDQVIGNVEKGVRTHSSYNQASNFILLSQIEPKNISEAKDD